MPDLAAELPLVVIAELFGIPYEDRTKIFEWSNRLIGANDPEYAGEDAEHAMNASLELYAYAQSLADDRRARPMDDIVTTLVTAELDGEKLSDIEFNVFVLLLSVAGNETTRNLISGGMLALMENPDQKERLIADLDGLLPTAVDEMLRYVSPVQYFRRTATSDTELRGVADHGRRQGHDLVRRGEPGRGGLPRGAALRRRPHAERAHRVRRPRAALLPRCEPGEDGDPGDVRGDPHPAARHADGGGAGAAALER